MGSIADVKHVIVMMQENRSFDQYFGTLPGVRGFYDPNVSPTSFRQKRVNPVVTNPPLPTLPPPGYLLPFPLSIHTDYPGPGHSWGEQHTSFNNGKWDQWLKAQTDACMGYYLGADIPYHFALAQTFTICDAYFSSVLGPTTPNRLYLMSGTCGKQDTNPGGTPDTHGNLYDWKCYPQLLNDAGVSWKIYEEDPSDLPGTTPWDMNVAAYFEHWDPSATNTDSHGFENDLENHTLATVSWIIPPISKSEHPDHPPAAGAQYLAGKISSFMKSVYWKDTVFLLLYDENSGIYDHMVPPLPKTSDTSEWLNGEIIGPGVRVPAIVISPWSVGGRVCQMPFDHTSALRFVGLVTGVPPEHISEYRRATFGDLTDALDFSQHVDIADVPPLPTPPASPAHPAGTIEPKRPQSWPPIAPACSFILQRSTFGEIEVEASSPALFSSALFIVFEGVTPDALGVTSLSLSGNALSAVAPHIDVLPGTPSLNFMPKRVSSDNSALPQHSPQRLTFTYDAQFADATAFGPAGATKTLTLRVSKAGVVAETQIQLVSATDPYFQNGSNRALSQDLRVFKVTAGETHPAFRGIAPPTDKTDAPRYIKDVLAALNAGGHAVDDFNKLGTSEDAQSLELSSKLNHKLVFNFAVARLHYLQTSAPIATGMAWRVFFRLFRTMSTITNYDQHTTYRRTSDIALLGLLGGEVATIPCFAHGRVTVHQGLDTQTDPLNARAYSQLNVSPKVQTEYFGCWLDFNQNETNDKRYPVRPAPSSNGPFNGVSGLKSVSELIVNRHVCLVAEIDFAPTTIPANASTGQTDKLAQRNLDIVGSENPGIPASHRIPTTFEIKPTAPNLAAAGKLDELMLDWSGLPAGSMATIYMPEISAAAVQLWVSQHCGSFPYTRVDDHTVRCAASGVTYLPIPTGAAGNITGLLTVDLPKNITRGQRFHVEARQISSAGITSTSTTIEGRAVVTPLGWRHVLGSFSIDIPVLHKQELIDEERRTLEALRGSMPGRDDRWYLVFMRYLEEIAARVAALS